MACTIDIFAFRNPEVGWPNSSPNILVRCERTLNSHTRGGASYIFDLLVLLGPPGWLELVEEERSTTLGLRVGLECSHGHMSSFLFVTIGCNGGIAFHADFIPDCQ